MASLVSPTFTEGLHLAGANFALGRALEKGLEDDFEPNNEGLEFKVKERRFPPMDPGGH